MKTLWIAIGLIAFVGSGHCADKSKQSTQKAQKVTKAKKPSVRVSPPLGLYEVKVFNMEWVQYGENDYSTNHYQIENNFKWLRLYKNGTYKTNLSKTGKPEGRFNYNHKKKEVIFYEFRPGTHEDDDLIYHKQPAQYGYNPVTGTAGQIIYWHHEHYSAVHHDYVECRWVKP